MRYFIISSLFLMVIFSACDSQQDDRLCMCPAVFVKHYLYVFNQSGNPIDGMRVEVEDPATGKIYYRYTQPYELYQPGGYLVMSDEYKEYFSLSPKLVEVTLRSDSMMIEQMLWFSVDDCNCNTHKTAGPDTLFL